MSSTSTSTETATTDHQRPLAAQIPLSSFSLPTFPPEADSLKSLTLSCDIPLSEYSTLLSQAQPPGFNITIPPTIDSLTLELFSFGYPPGFLTALAEKLPNLRALTVYAQLFAGTTEASRGDARAFFEVVGRGLREVCLVDAFSEAGFWTEVASLVGGVRFLEVTYSYRHGEEGLKGVHGEELVGLVGRETVGCVLALHKPVKNERIGEEGVEEKEEEDVEDGILPFADAKVLVERLTGPEKPKSLAILDTTLFKLTGEQLRAIVKENDSIKVLSVTLEVGVDGIEDEYLGNCWELESLEIVVCPVLETVENAKQGKEVGILEKDVLNIAGKYPNMTSLKTSILRTQEVEWKKSGGGGWTKV